MEAFNDWFDHFHKGQPVRPVLAEGASFTEKVAHEQREKVYQGRWRGGEVARLFKVDKLRRGLELCWPSLAAGWLKRRESKT